MWRPPLAALLTLTLALPAVADDSVYAGNDAEKETRLRRLFTPLELSLFLIADKPETRGDPVVSFYDAAKVEQVKRHQTDMLAALDGATPDYTRALRGMEGIRSILAAPAAQNYVRASEAAAGSNAAYGAFETALLNSYLLYWYPGRGGSQPPLPEVSRGRALLRAEARAYLANRPTGRVDYMAALRAAQANTSAAMGSDHAAHARLFAAAGMRAPEAPAPDPGPINDRAARLRARMPEPQFSDLERRILATVLTDAELEAVVAGSSTRDLKKEALDAANLAMADQENAEIRAAIAAKTHYKPDSLAALRRSIPPADMSRFVCGAMERQRAPELTGGQGTARADLERSAAEADVIRVETTALPGIVQYCRDSASLRAPATTGPAQTDTRPVAPQQRIGPMANVPGAGRPVGNGEGGGFLSGLGDKLKAGLPYAALGAGAGAIVGAALGGPAGLLAGALIGALFGVGLSLFGGKVGGSS